MQVETIGRRIARLRQENGWTQQTLAARLAISRVAVSHIEMDLSVPSERTVTLLAGVFKISPHTLVEGTTYPQAKAEKLPAVACQHTGLEMDLALLESDLAWLARLADGAVSYPDWILLNEMIWEQWSYRLAVWEAETVDEREKEILARARQDFDHLAINRMDRTAPRRPPA